MAHFEEVDFQSALPQDLVLDALEHVDGLVGELESLGDEVVEMLNGGQVAEAMISMSQLFNKWNNVYQALHNICTLMQIDPADIQIDGDSGTELISGLLEQLQEVKRALEDKDFVLLADVLGYELKPSAEKMSRLVELLQQKIDKPDAGP